MVDALISADSHVVPLPSFWREYLPAHLRERAPRIEATDDGDVVVFGGQRSPVMAINSSGPGSHADQLTAPRR